MANSAPHLDVWLYGRRLAELSQLRSGRVHYRLDFTEEALDTFGEGRRVLSLSLPVSHRPVMDAVGNPQVTNFVNGLLPEGNLRQQIAAAQRVPTTDLMGILDTVGGDCAGAVQFLRPGTQAPTPTVRELSPAELARTVADLPTYNLPEGQLPQASLAGIQDKILVTDLGDGRWGLPLGGAASTHLIKPEPLTGTLPGLIHAEDWSMRVARTAGLDAAETRVESFDGRPAIVVTRYDRDESGRRIHQEDLCQALGLAPRDKYESLREAQTLGSRLARITARALPQAAGDPTALRTSLLRYITFNLVTGNGDAHSKNFSLMLGERGEVTLAPLYDCAPVMFMDSRFKGIGHVIAGKTRIGEVTDADLIAEASSWGLPERIAARTVAETVESVRESIATTAVPDGLSEMRANLDLFFSQRSWTGGSPAVAGEAPPTTSSATAGRDTDGMVLVHGHERRGRWVDEHWRARPTR